MNEDLRRVMKNIYTALRNDKIKFIRFCLERGHLKRDIAEVVGLTPSGLSHFIKRYLGDNRNRQDDTKGGKMKISNEAKKDIKEFLQQMKLLYKLTKEDLKLIEGGVTVIYKQGIIDGLNYKEEK